MFKKRIVRDDHLAEFRSFEPWRERLVSEYDSSTLSHDSRHFCKRLLWLTEVVKATEMEDGIKEGVWER
jgi:hypothetical protein